VVRRAAASGPRSGHIGAARFLVDSRHPHWGGLTASGWLYPVQVLMAVSWYGGKEAWIITMKLGEAPRLTRTAWKR
jgi:hypothetical protein